MDVSGIAVAKKKGTHQLPLWTKVRKEFSRNKYLYLMLLPVVVYYAVFHYAPMYGLVIAFKDFYPMRGIAGSPWVGLKHFADFFSSYYSWRLVRNVLAINFYDLLFGFPAPIILALLLNEIKNQRFKRTVQTVTYLPHFVSVVVIVGLMMDFFSRDGVINLILEGLGFEAIPFFNQPEFFRALYVGSGIWQAVGWGSIIYIASLSSIDPELYEAAACDGAGRWAQMRHITLPGIAPTIIIMFIMRMGRMLTVGFEKIILMYNPLTYETADVISTFVYRRGLLMADYSYSTAVGLVNSLINFIILVCVNKISRRVGETSLW
jgi:putative aldouronate transport system permease protein